MASARIDFISEHSSPVNDALERDPVTPGGGMTSESVSGEVSF